MRKPAGSAAAPAARCRNCLRWGSFIGALPRSRDAIQPISALRWPREVLPSQCPLLAQSGHGEVCLGMSAFGGEADIEKAMALCPLLTQSGHWALGEAPSISGQF